MDFVMKQALGGESSGMVLLNYQPTGLLLHQLPCPHPSIFL